MVGLNDSARYVQRTSLHSQMMEDNRAQLGDAS